MLHEQIEVASNRGCSIRPTSQGISPFIYKLVGVVDCVDEFIIEQEILLIDGLVPGLLKQLT